MDVRQLQHFLAVVDNGSITVAARQLRMSQPALSLSLQQLEREVGTKLFARSKKGMTPNAFGQALEERARLITTEIVRARRDLHDLHNLQRGHVIVGSSPTFSDPILSKAIIRFHSEHPRVQVRVFESHLSTLIAEVKTGAFDFALMTFPPQLLSDRDLDRIGFFSRRRVILVASANNPITADRRVSARKALSCRWLLPAKSDFFRADIETQFTRRKLPPPEATIEYLSTPAAKRLVAEGPYIAFFAEMMVRDELSRGLFKEVQSPDLVWHIDRMAGAVFRRTPALTPAASKFIEVIATVSRELTR